MATGKARRTLLGTAVACAIACPSFGAPAAAAEAAPRRATGTGFVTDESHPKHPDDFGTYDVTVRVAFDPARGEAVISFAFGPPDSQVVKNRYLYHQRRGRIFQVDDHGAEILPEPVGDLWPSVIAAIHPALVRVAMRERPECVRRIDGELLFAWNDELWTIEVDGDSPSERLTGARFDYASPLHGDQTFAVRYEGWPAGAGALSPGRVVVNTRGRDVLLVNFTTDEPVESVGIVTGDRERDRERLAAEAEIVPREIAPHLFTIDLTSLNMRVCLAEFHDYLLVFEGAWDSRNADAIAARVRKRFAKPIRYFAFSHLHSQYIAGTRSWIHEGATVLVPPSTVPLVESIVGEGRRLRPDRLAADPRPLKMELVPDLRRIEDGVNAAEIYNVESGHTDEYLIVYFPRQKVLLTGDLLFYRPGKPLSDRSLKLCETVRELGLDVGTYVATWPLEGYDTKNVVTGAEMREACPR